MPKVAEAAAARLLIPNHAEISVTIVDDLHIAGLNKEYRGIEGPTDVLSFCLYETGELESRATEPLLLGEVVVSAERAAIQAEDYGHSLERELAFLVVHGILHLMGYEHDEEIGEMGSVAEEILASIGLSR